MLWFIFLAFLKHIEPIFTLILSEFKKTLLLKNLETMAIHPALYVKTLCKYFMIIIILAEHFCYTPIQQSVILTEEAPL